MKCIVQPRKLSFFNCFVFISKHKRCSTLAPFSNPIYMLQEHNDLEKPRTIIIVLVQVLFMNHWICPFCKFINRVSNIFGCEKQRNKLDKSSARYLSLVKQPVT